MLPARQLLSPIIGLAMMATSSFGQQAAPAAVGNDYVRFKPATAGAQPRVLQGVLITGIVGGKAMIKDAAGEIGYAVETLDEVRKAVPPEWAAGSRAIEAGELDKAIPLIRSVAEKFRGLPTTWAQDANASLGGLLITAGKLSDAETALSAFSQAYPNAGGAVANVGKARLAAAKKQFGEAKSLAGPIVEGALSKKVVSRGDSQVFGQAFFVLGQVAEGENKLPEAMEAYCRTVALFYQDRATVAAAQQRIDDLRKKGVAVP
jgi:predicted Zn-dependent protease